MSIAWHHGPLHVLVERGIYMVTAGTHAKFGHFHSSERLRLVHDGLHQVAEEYGWRLQAWAVLSNHYHFVASSPDDPSTLRKMLGKLHTFTGKAVNEQDSMPGRKVWHQYWDTRLTFEAIVSGAIELRSSKPGPSSYRDACDSVPLVFGSSVRSGRAARISKDRGRHADRESQCEGRFLKVRRERGSAWSAAARPARRRLRRRSLTRRGSGVLQAE